MNICGELFRLWRAGCGRRGGLFTVVLAQLSAYVDALSAPLQRAGYSSAWGSN